MRTHHKTYTEEVGFVVAAKEYLVHLEGLPSVRINDVIENDEGRRALVLALNEDVVQALMLDPGDTYAGDRFYIRERGVSFSMGDHLFGRVISAVGDNLDEGSGFPPGNTNLRIEHHAPDINTRADITEQLHTGLTLVDTLVPIGKGQRQLVVGPFGSGKEIFLTDVVLNQRANDIVCIYAFIGKPTIYVEEMMRRLFNHHTNPHTIGLVALSNDPAPKIFIAPSSALSMAEYFSNQGRDVLVVLDDLGTHAKYLREIELLAGRIPGRESYPGDIFYQHAHIMERAGRFNKRLGGGSITLLPVLETNIEESSDLIATNIMAATDGHIFFSSELHGEGYYPAVVSKNSVTRVGRKTQNRLQNALSSRVQILLAEYEQQKEFSRFGAELGEEGRKTLRRGDMLRTILRQDIGTQVGTELQILLLGLIFSSYLDNKNMSELEHSKEHLVKLFGTSSQFTALRDSAKRGIVALPQFLKEIDNMSTLIDSVWQR
ncbi:MAG TPA: hypothetical protein VGA06_01555 [Candidatus Paceibacterota bacterium]